jgi:hypothetical protein
VTVRRERVSGEIMGCPFGAKVTVRCGRKGPTFRTSSYCLTILPSVTLQGKGESAMIRLTDEQLPALDAPEQPPVAIDPRTGQEYLLVRREVYEKMQLVLKPFARGWDDPRLDDYEIYRKKKA